MRPREGGSAETPDPATKNARPVPGGLQILLLSVAMEGVLGGLGLFWIAQQGRNAVQVIGPSPEGAAVGLAMAAVAMAIVGLSHDLVVPHISWLNGWRDWVEGQLLPFLAPLTTWQMLGVAVSAGVGEELLFRGAMQPALGLIPTAIIFGLAHIGGLLKRETLPFFLYTLFWGLVFGWLYDLLRVLWPLIVMHAGFDIAIVLYLRSSWRPTRAGS